MTQIYLDNHATTQMSHEVRQAMEPYWVEHFGNTHSPHPFGWVAKEAVEQARAQVAETLGADSREIYFTSGATEANNWAILGLLERFSFSGHVITTVCEHKSVLNTCAYAEKRGVQVTYLPVDHEGSVRLEQIQQALRPDTRLVSIMAANNEIGTIYPTAEIGRLCKEQGTLLHVDAAQAVGKLAVDVQEWQVDLLSLSAHKFHGPKGVGALFVRRQNPRVRLAPLLHGGEQEGGLRPGTLNVPGIVGLGAACQHLEVASAAQKISQLRDFFLQGLQALHPDMRLNGPRHKRLCNHLSVTLPMLKEGLSPLTLLRGLAVSTGSACAAGTGQISHVLKAIGLERGLAQKTVRFGLSRYTTQSELSEALKIIGQALNP